MPHLLLLFITVPLITAFVGWVTNWAAVKMIFLPERFVGIGPIGWQGILIRRAPKFALGVADVVTEHLISPKEMAEKLDPEEMEKIFGDTLDQQTESIVRRAAEVVNPGAWDTLMPPVQQMVVTQVKNESKTLVRELFDKLQGLSSELLDLRRLIVSSLSGDNTRTLVRLTKKIGAKEFTFIEYYGGVFGFLIGLVQAGLYTYMQKWWLMPIVGAIVGIVTNWLAIQMIFRPQEPTKYLGLITYQGLFPKRQAEISRDYGTVAANEILTPKNLIRLVSDGEAGERLATIVIDTINQRIDERYETMKNMMPIQVTPETLERVKTMIVDQIVETAPTVQPEFEAYLSRKLDISNTIETKLGQLPKADFERILRGIFEEDEAILIAVGGVLGLLVGLMQATLVLWM